MAIEGTLDLFQLPEILQVIAHQGKTGILTIQGEADIVAISFENGKVVAGDALNQTLEESLGEVLSGQGLVSPSDFAEVSAGHQAGDGRFLDLLVERAYIDREQLLDALRLHTYRLLVELLGWNAGEFKFYSGDEVSYEEGFRPISIDELLIRSVEEAAGEGHPTIPDSRSTYEPVEPSLPLRVRKGGEEPTTERGVVWLTENENHLRELLAGGSTVSSLVDRSGENEYKVRYVLHRLLEARVVRRRPAPRKPAPEPAVPPPTPEPASRAARPVPVAPALDGVELAQPAQEPDGPATPPPPSAASVTSDRTRLLWWTSAWVGRLLALLPVVLVAALLASQPAVVPLPFPWQVAQREAVEKELRASLFLEIDRAAKTFYLLEGRFPPSLGSLVELGLIAPADLRDPAGRLFTYLPDESSYVLQSLVEGEPVPAASATEAVTGNFLLDPEFLSPPSTAGRQPLVLLD